MTMLRNFAQKVKKLVKPAPGQTLSNSFTSRLTYFLAFFIPGLFLGPVYYLCFLFGFCSALIWFIFSSL